MISYITQVEVLEIIEHRLGVREYVVRPEQVRHYNPGSFVQLTLDIVNASNIWPESRTFSIASYEKGIMRFIIKENGGYTTRIFKELRIGSKCTIKYPFGELFSKSTIEERHLLIAGGLGITPFLGLIDFHRNNGTINNVVVFYSVKYSNELLKLDFLEKTLGNNLVVFVTRENNKLYHHRHISIEDIKKKSDLKTNIYICGSKAFSQNYYNLLIANHYVKVHMDQWD